jgi:hypothetical protein
MPSKESRPTKPIGANRAASPALKTIAKAVAVDKSPL